jgi:hypothetical protein
VSAEVLEAAEAAAMAVLRPRDRLGALLGGRGRGVAHLESKAARKARTKAWTDVYDAWQEEDDVTDDLREAGLLPNTRMNGCRDLADVLINLDRSR